MSDRFDWERTDREALRKAEQVIEAKRHARVLYENATLLLQSLITNESISIDRLGRCQDACDKLQKLAFTTKSTG
jgi:hypothetical protein